MVRNIFDGFIIVKLLKIIIDNFKGIKSLEVSFGEETLIGGDNGTNKTSILDAFLWVLFGKDSLGRNIFEVKTLDKEGNQLHGLEHRVKVFLWVNGVEISLERILKEKWVKKKGEAEKVFTGHNTTYKINDTPVSMKEYTDKINEIIDEEVFKQVTNVNYFNNLPWGKQREVLGELVGVVLPREVIKENPNLLKLSEILEDVEVFDYRKQLKFRMDKFNEEIIAIPPRIDECNNQIVLEDFKALPLKREEILLKIEDLKREDKGRAEFFIKINEITAKLYEEKENLRKREMEALENSRLNQEKLKLRDVNERIAFNNLNEELCEKKYSSVYERVAELKNTLEVYEISQENLRREWKEENSKKYLFSEEEKVCPTCHREYDSEALEGIKEKGESIFEERKDITLKRINREGKKFGEVIKELKDKVKEDEVSLSLMDEQRSAIEDIALSLRSEKREIENNITMIKESKEPFEGRDDILFRITLFEKELEELNKKTPIKNEGEIKCLEKELEEVNRKRIIEERNNTLAERIKDLEERGKYLSIELSEVEKLDSLCEEFIRTKVKIIERRFNGKFKDIRFKLFKEQINGGIAECCECTSNGVPFSNLNTAAKVNCGLEIINALSEHYKVSAPIFIDNREAVNEIVETKSQLINLMVTRDKPLVVKKVKEISFETKGEKALNNERKLDF